MIFLISYFDEVNAMVSRINAILLIIIFSFLHLIFHKRIVLIRLGIDYQTLWAERFHPFYISGNIVIFAKFYNNESHI
jgi:hypothetical protein